MACGWSPLAGNQILEIHLKQGTKVKRDKGTKFGFFFLNFFVKKTILM
jgi:hypothetical protein